MKNILPAILACVVAGGVTFFGLTLFSGKPLFSSSDSPKTEATEATDSEGSESSDEFDMEFGEEGEGEEGEGEENPEEEEPEPDEIEGGETEGSDSSEGTEEGGETASAEENKESHSSKSSSASSTSSHSSSSSGKVNLSSILSDYKTWSKYNKANIELAYDFTPVDENGSEISKKDFLQQLKTGSFVPVKEGSGLTYKLYNLDDSVDKKIGRGVKSAAGSALHYYNMEGTDFPAFSGFKDLTGNTHSSSQLKGKVTVMKCWFVRCTSCVKEFPELNDLYEKYEGNGNVEFLSFAFDKNSQLKDFLAKKSFLYPVIGEQQNFIMKDIKAKQFPLHILVDKNGKIVKMVNNVHALVHFLEKEVKK